MRREADAHGHVADGVLEDQVPANNPGDGHENEREGNGWASTRAAKRRVVVDEILEERRVQDRGGLEFLAGYCGADDRENAGTDDRTNAERRETDPPEELFQPEFRAFTIGNELIDVLASEQGRSHSGSPIVSGQ